MSARLTTNHARADRKYERTNKQGLFAAITILRFVEALRVVVETDAHRTIGLMGSRVREAVRLDIPFQTGGLRNPWGWRAVNTSASGKVGSAPIVAACVSMAVHGINQLEGAHDRSTPGRDASETPDR